MGQKKLEVSLQMFQEDIKIKAEYKQLLSH